MTDRRRKLHLGLLVCLLLGLLGPAIAQIGKQEDFAGFLAFGRLALSGGVPYHMEADVLPGHWATWTPGFVPVAAALARLDSLAPLPTQLLWQVLNLAALVAVLVVVARWVAAPDRLTAMLVALLVPYRFVLENVVHVQSNLLILALVVGGLWMMERRRWWGGLLFGLGAVWKATPLLLLVYLAWRGRWRDLAAATAGVLVAGILLPATVIGPRALGIWYGGWRESSSRAWAEAVADSGFMNQSALAIGVRFTDAGTGPFVWILVAGLLGVVAALSFGSPFRPSPPARTAFEISFVLVGATLLSPLAWKAHYATLVPLTLCLFAALPSIPPRRRWVLWLAGAAVNLTASDLIGKAPARFLESGGIVFWVAVLLLGAAALRCRAVGGPPPSWSTSC